MNIATRLKKVLLKKNKLKDKKTVQVASSSVTLLPNYLDANGKCYHMQILDSLSDDYVERFYKLHLPSFESHNATSNIVVNENDFKTLITSHRSYINDVAHLSGRSEDQVLLDFARYHNNKTFIIQPAGISGIIHKGSNLFYLSGTMAQTFTSVATSHLSGVTGLSLLGASPMLVISLPFVGGVFFAGCERIAANTPLQPICTVARDVCLIPTKIFEIAYNEVLVGPMLRGVFGIDAPLNISSFLRFGAGTKMVLGKAVNGTTAALANSSPEKAIKVWKWIMGN